MSERGKGIKKEKKRKKKRKEEESSSLSEGDKEEITQRGRDRTRGGRGVSV